MTSLPIKKVAFDLYTRARISFPDAAYPTKSIMANPKYINSDHRDLDSEKGKTDYLEWQEADEAYRESWLLLNDREEEEEDLTTDPLLAHKL